MRNVKASNALELLEASEDFRAGVESVTCIRCMRHLQIPSFNCNEYSGGECGACIAKSAASSKFLWFVFGALFGGFAAVFGVLW